MNQVSAPISVVIPCYNQAKYLGEAIESVLAQTYKNFDIIVIDDGSPDDVKEVTSRYPQVRCIRQENQGLAAARNTGLCASEGEFIVFLDSDDVLLPEALAVGVEALAEHPGCAFVFGDFDVVDVNRVPLPPWQQPAHEDDPYLALLRRNYIAMHSAVMFRRDVVVEVGGFDRSLRSAEDYDLYLRITRTYRVHYHGKLVSEYRRHGSGLSGNPVQMIECVLTVFRKQWPYVKGRREYEEAYRTGLRHYRWRFGEQLVERIRTRVKDGTDRRRVMKDVWALIRYYPNGFVRHAGRKLYCTLTGRSD